LRIRSVFFIECILVKDRVMRKLAIRLSASALFIMPHLAFAQKGTAANVMTGTVTGAAVGGPVGAVIGAGVGGIAGQNARAQSTPDVVVIPDPATTGSIRQRTCSVDMRGNQSCTEVIR
jgi:hypothetical protein